MNIVLERWSALAYNRASSNSEVFMKFENSLNAFVNWLTKSPPEIVLIPVLAMALSAFVVYAVFWKGRK